MSKVCKVKCEMYVPSVQEYVASVVRSAYIGKGLHRWEELTNWRTSDWPDTIRNRFSEDNGKTWSAWKLLHSEWPLQKGHAREEGPWCNCYDPATPPWSIPLSDRVSRTVGFQFPPDPSFRRNSIASEQSWQAPDRLSWRDFVR